MAQRRTDKVRVEEAKAKALAAAAGIDHDARREFARRKWVYLGGATAAGLLLSWTASGVRARAARKRR